MESISKTDPLEGAKYGELGSGSAAGFKKLKFPSAEMVDSGVVKKPGEVRPFYYDEEGNIYTPPPGPSRPIAPDPFGALRDAGNLIESDRGDEAAGNSHVHSTLASMSRLATLQARQLRNWRQAACRRLSAPYWSI